MKVNKLSIGDWVQARMIIFQGEERLTPPMRVVALGETWVQLQIDPEAGDPDEYDIKDIRPVPLTEDIIFKNFKEWQKRPNLYWIGWSYSHERTITHEISIEWRYPRWKFTLQEYTYPAIHLTRTILCVHELQHALRLAGIEKEIEL